MTDQITPTGITRRPIEDPEEAAEAQAVARTILDQIKAFDRWALGAWGARNFLSFSGTSACVPGHDIGGRGGVRFRVRGTKPGMARCAGIVIGLNGSDLYDVAAIRWNGTEVKVLAGASDVYFDNLVETINSFVG